MPLWSLSAGPAAKRFWTCKESSSGIFETCSEFHRPVRIARRMAEAGINGGAAEWSAMRNDTSLVSVISGGVFFLLVLFLSLLVVPSSGADGCCPTGSLESTVRSGGHRLDDCRVEHDFHDIRLRVHGLDCIVVRVVCLCVCVSWLRPRCASVGVRAWVGGRLGSGHAQYPASSRSHGYLTCACALAQAVQPACAIKAARKGASPRHGPKHRPECNAVCCHGGCARLLFLCSDAFESG